MAILFIYIVFIFAFLGNSFVDYRLMPAHVTIVTEASVYLLFLYSLLFSGRFKSKRYSLSLWLPYCLFLAVAFFSITFNGYFNLQPLASLRLILRFYLFYLTLINLGLDDTMLKRINKLLFILFIIQLPTSAIKFSKYGISELTIGTYASHGGILTAVIPIVALGYLAGYYFFYERRFYYVLLAIGFILYGIAGEKRALLFIYPITFMGIYYLLFIIEKKENIIKQFGVMTFIIMLSIAVSAVIVKYHIGYNYPTGAGGKIDFVKALKFAKEYTTHREENKAFGRMAMTQLAFEIAYTDASSLLFGYGPGSTTSSILSKHFDRRLIPIYQSAGKTGLVIVLIEYGLIGLFAVGSVFLILAYRCWRWFKYEKDPYWKAFSMGSLVFSAYIAFIFFFYSHIPIHGDTLPPVYFYAMATMHIKMKEIANKEGHYEVIAK